MAESNDQSKVSTLPHPELNPLLNPLLAANMGRWAEVYFTSPPEKREQAVVDLLQELGEIPPAPHSANTSDLGHGADVDVSHKIDPSPEDPSPLEDVPPKDLLQEQEKGSKKKEQETTALDFQLAPQHASLVCVSCGHRSQDTQRFCGMCGAMFNASSSGGMQFAARRTVPGETTADRLEENSPILAGDKISQAAEPSESERYWEFTRPSHTHSETTSLHVQTLFGTRLSDEKILNREPHSVHRSYRAYLGGVLALLIALMIYMTWRSTSAFKGVTYSTRPPEEPLANSPPSEARGAVPPAVAEPRAKPTTPAFVARDKPRNTTAPHNPAGAGPAATRSGPPEKSGSGHIDANGNQELSNAEKYLKGNPRDSHQAANWLWKAVAKENLTASVMLSDLYLRGDGVTKNCDQARLLLDSAARKGMGAAAERLRNLRAFGCP